MPTKRLNKDYPGKLSKDETLEGYYDETTNTIKISSDLTEEQMAHIFGHELIHYMEAVTHRLNEEGRCDTLGSYLIKMMKITSLEGFLDERKLKRVRKKAE